MSPAVVSDQGAWAEASTRPWYEDRRQPGGPVDVVVTAYPFGTIGADDTGASFVLGCKACQRVDTYRFEKRVNGCAPVAAQCIHCGAWMAMRSPLAQHERRRQAPELFDGR